MRSCDPSSIPGPAWLPPGAYAIINFGDFESIEDAVLQMQSIITAHPPVEGEPDFAWRVVEDILLHMKQGEVPTLNGCAWIIATCNARRGGLVPQGVLTDLHLAFAA